MKSDPVRFLLVDDLAENLLSLEAVLRRDGLTIHTARSAREALELLLQHDFALAIVDVQMPELDGFEMAELMRGTERTRHVPIIFLTAADNDALRRFKGYESGAVDFLQKPVEPLILRSKADVFINLYRQRQQIEYQRDQLIANQERLQLALRAGRIGVWEWTLPTHHVMWSDEVCRIFGFEPGTFPGTQTAMVELIHPADRDTFTDTLQAALLNEDRFCVEFRIVRSQTGEVRHLTNIGTVRRSNNVPVSVVGMITDVTEQRAAEAALRQRERELQSLSDNSPNIIARFDREFRHVFVNATVEYFTGISAETFLGKTNRELGMPKEACDLWESALQRVFDTPLPESITFQYDYAGGTRSFESQLIPERNAEGIVQHVLSVTRDVTSEWIAKQELNQAKEAAELANQAKDAFLAVVSHELRTPMTAILGYTDLVLERTRDNEMRNYLQIVRQNSGYLLEIINDILDISKINAGKLDVVKDAFSPYMVIEDVCRIMDCRAKEKGLELQVQIHRDVPQSIVSDAKRLKQILINLVGNAIKFTKEGYVALNVSYLEDGLLKFDIIDTGIGIARDQLDNLFQPFSQGDSSVSRRFGGTGLGLVISMRLARMLGGMISVHSELDQGSTFSFTIATGDIGQLQTGHFSIRDQQAQSSEEQTSLQHRRVLVVDDRREIRYLSRHLLEKAGAQVDEVENGQQAVEYVENGLKVDFLPHLVLLDMQMPILDGYSTATQLRYLGFEGPIVALTGDAMQDDRNRCIESGCTSYLSKPIDAKRLISLVGELTKEYQLDATANS